MSTYALPCPAGYYVKMKMINRLSGCTSIELDYLYSIGL